MDLPSSGGSLSTSVDHDSQRQREATAQERPSLIKTKIKQMMFTENTDSTRKLVGSTNEEEMSQFDAPSMTRDEKKIDMFIENMSQVHTAQERPSLIKQMMFNGNMDSTRTLVGSTNEEQMSQFDAPSMTRDEKKNDIFIENMSQFHIAQERPSLIKTNIKQMMFNDHNDSTRTLVGSTNEEQMSQFDAPRMTRDEKKNYMFIENVFELYTAKAQPSLIKTNIKQIKNNVGRKEERKPVIEHTPIDKDNVPHAFDDWLEHCRDPIALSRRAALHPGRRDTYDPVVQHPKDVYNPYEDKQFMMEYKAEQMMFTRSRQEDTPESTRQTVNAPGIIKASSQLGSMVRKTKACADNKGEDPSYPFYPKEVLHIIRLLPGNNVCCDCGQDERSGGPIVWSSVTYGTLLCKECAFRHATKGEEVSFCI